MQFNPTPLCSVICVTYNHAEFAGQGLQSIFDQTYRNLEIIVLDDGSTDETGSVIRKTLEASPFPSKFIEQDNTGNVPGNFNKALMHAKGTFITFLSLDDMLLPDCIEARIKFLQSDDQMVFAADTGYQEIDANGTVINADGQMPVADYQIHDAAGLLEAEYQEIGTFYIQGQVFRHDAVRAFGGFDNTMTGDDIILRTKLFCYMIDHPELQFHLGDATMFAYRKHSGNLHKRSLRQFKTVIEWKKAFFPDRPYPKMFYLWLENYFRDCVRHDQHAELKTALAYSPVVAEHYSRYSKTWKMRRRLLKSRIRCSLGLSRSHT